MRLVFSLIVLSALTACGQPQKTTNNDSTATEEATVTNINGDQATPLLADSSVVTIDVRTPGEIQAGYITGTDQFMDFNAGEFQKQLNTLDKDKKYLLYCRSGGRSGSAAQMMIKAGFTQVYNLKGGISRWSGPTTK